MKQKLKKIAAHPVHSGHALFVVVCSASIPAILFFGLLFHEAPEVDAISSIAIQVMGAPITCSTSYNPQTQRCLACTACGTTSTCTQLSEVLVRPYRPSFRTSLANGTSLCLTQKDVARPPKGGSFRPGANCIGGVLFIRPNQHTLFNNFGCSQ